MDDAWLLFTVPALELCIDSAELLLDTLKPAWAFVEDVDVSLVLIPLLRLRTVWVHALIVMVTSGVGWPAGAGVEMIVNDELCVAAVTALFASSSIPPTPNATLYQRPHRHTASVTITLKRTMLTAASRDMADTRRMMGKLCVAMVQECAQASAGIVVKQSIASVGSPFLVSSKLYACQCTAVKFVLSPVGSWASRGGQRMMTLCRAVATRAMRPLLTVLRCGVCGGHHLQRPNTTPQLPPVGRAIAPQDLKSDS